MPIRKLKIFREQAKDRLTIHWDLDCLTTKDLEAAFSGRAQQSDNTEEVQSRVRKLLSRLGLVQTS